MSKRIDAARSSCRAILILLLFPCFWSLVQAQTFHEAARIAAYRWSASRPSAYFPLKVGHKWVYAQQNASTSTWEVEVTAERVDTSGRTYFEIKGYFGEETRLVRSTVIGDIVERGFEGPDFLWYRMAAPVGFQWLRRLAPPDTASCEDGVRLAMGSRTETVTVPAGTFTDVIRVDTIAPRCADSGIAREWFAPGIGLIKRTVQTFIGPVTSELVYAELGDEALPRPLYSAALHLNGPRFTNNLMPPIGPDSLPKLHGIFVVHNRTGLPAKLTFPGCHRLLIVISNAKGEKVRELEVESGGCCECNSTAVVDLAKRTLVLPFAFTLADEDGKPLPEGLYSVFVTPLSLEPETLRPSVQLPIEVTSVY